MKRTLLGAVFLGMTTAGNAWAGQIERPTVTNRDVPYMSGKEPVSTSETRPDCTMPPPHRRTEAAWWIWEQQHKNTCKRPQTDGPERQSRPEPKKPEPKKPEPPVCE